MTVIIDSPRGREILGDILRLATYREAETHGASRRVAFRTTRNLIEGAIRAGFSVPVIADALRVKENTVRSRSGVDGVITPTDFAELSGVTEGTIERWHTAGLIELLGPDRSGTVGYRASALIVAHIGHELSTGGARPVGGGHSTRATGRPRPAL